MSAGVYEGAAWPIYLALHLHSLRAVAFYNKGFEPLWRRERTHNVLTALLE